MNTARNRLKMLKTLLVMIAICLFARDAIAQPVRSQPFRDGGSFVGTHAYDAQVGYDDGQYDDNGRPSSFYKDNRGREPRTPGKRGDPGDIDFVDFYYEGVLRNDGTLNDYDDLRATSANHTALGRGDYWRRSLYRPLRYDDFAGYQRFRYQLGNDSANK